MTDTRYPDLPVPEVRNTPTPKRSEREPILPKNPKKDK
ncbi:Uncharacterised protein [Weissella viridescens]|uniref:Uncharacterized protein n=1 Tax=Weissella viridescens TaxID=1629 RepID=A0A380P2R6_WEIVI|nr:Uncharacterised protein [Weissella viridescens]